jgi:hypothetical protein
MNFFSSAVPELVVVDMFCGAGGITTGLTQTCRELGIQPKIIAINHWNVAIETHKRNHPEATHWCERVDSLDPRKLTPDGRIDFLIAAPKCTHHSVARGRKPINDQSRVSAWQVVRYAEALSPRHILLENVRRPAREIIDWSLPSKSVFSRKKPLALATLKRLGASLSKFSGKAAGRGNQRQYAINNSLPTVTSADTWALVEPFIVTASHGDSDPGRCRSVDSPLPTDTCSNDHAAVQSFMVPFLVSGSGKIRAHTLLRNRFPPSPDTELLLASVANVKNRGNARENG